MAYDRALPLMVIVEEGVSEEGLLERGNDWYVQAIKPEASALNSVEFNGVLSSWKEKVQHRQAILPNSPIKPIISVGDLTIRDLLTGLKPAQLWSILAALVGLVGASLVLGAQFASKIVKP